MLLNADPKEYISRIEATRGDAAAATSHTASVAKWVGRISEVRGSRPVNLLCFPFAGGGASAFAKWQSNLSDQIKVYPIQYPGRENRWGETGFANIESLVEALANDLAPLWVEPFALLGHSFGALLAFELTRALARKGYPAPVRLIVSGARAPQLPRRESIHELPDSLFLERLCKYDGLPDEILRNRDLIAAVLPIIRADFRLFEQYRFYDDAVISTPISVLGGLNDSSVPIADLLAWSSQTCKSFRSRFFQGNHFFLFQQSEALTHIVEDLQASARI